MSSMPTRKSILLLLLLLLCDNRYARPQPRECDSIPHHQRYGLCFRSMFRDGVPFHNTRMNHVLNSSAAFLKCSKIEVQLLILPSAILLVHGDLQSRIFEKLDRGVGAPEVVSLFQSLCLSTLSAFWVVLGLTARSCLCACLVLNTVANFLPAPPPPSSQALAMTKLPPPQKW